VAGSTEHEMNEIDEHRQFALILLLAITGIALITGAVAAVYIVRRNISRPLSEVVAGLEALGADDMSVEVKVHSDDEIGAVAKAYADFKKTLMKLTAAINARKQTQQALNASWRRFVDIAELSQDWIWESDDDHIITYMSDHFFTKTGMDRNKILNQRWDEIGIKSGMKKLHEKLDLQQPFHDVNISTQAVKGKTGQFLISGKPVIDESNTFNGYRGVGICASAGQASGEQSEESKEYSGRLGEFINLAVMEEAAADGEKDGVQLTPREGEVLDWVRKGKSYADIAEILSISRRTVEFHIKNVMDKLGASNRVSAVVIAMRRGILGA